MVGRLVVVLCGPPGAGKSTLARASGLAVYDRDDPQWVGDRAFRGALAGLRLDGSARAVVIRSGASSSARARAAELVGATHVYLVLADRDELRRRVRARGRHDLVRTVAGVDRWFEQHDRLDGVPVFPGWGAVFASAGGCAPGVGMGVTSQAW